MRCTSKEALPGTAQGQTAAKRFATLPFFYFYYLQMYYSWEKEVAKGHALNLF